MSKMLFNLGAVVATPASLQALETVSTGPQTLLARHVTGDWGEGYPEDKELNNEALTLGNRLMSVYKLTTDLTVWVITEADRSVTTILLPEEY